MCRAGRNGLSLGFFVLFIGEVVSLARSRARAVCTGRKRMTRKSEIPRMRRRRVAMTLGRLLTRMFQLFVPNNSSGNFFLLPRPLCRFIVRGHRTARARHHSAQFVLYGRYIQGEYNTRGSPPLDKFLKSNPEKSQLCTHNSVLHLR